MMSPPNLTRPVILLPAAVVALAALAVATAAVAQNATSTGSVGCAALTQAAADGVGNRVKADDTDINAPSSVTQLTCLDNFFNGVGLNLVTNLINPANLLTAVEGQICGLVKTTWSQQLGGAQCGLTVTGFDLAFGGIGGGLSCPKLTFGGGGPPIGTIGTGTANNGGGLYIQGNGVGPTGYTVPNLTPGTF